jgi:hypothetical protein
MGWKEPTYSLFLQRIGKCGAAHYTYICSTTNPKNKKLNNDVFALYLTEIQNKLADTWRIPTETIQDFSQIAIFEASLHSVWLQDKRDLAKEWLQLNYCMNMQDIHMEVQEWLEEWRIPTISKTMPGGQTRTQDGTTPAQQTSTNDASKKKNIEKGQEGGSSPIQKKTRTQKKSQRGSTQKLSCMELETRGVT